MGILGKNGLDRPFLGLAHVDMNLLKEGEVAVSSTAGALGCSSHVGVSRRLLEDCPLLRKLKVDTDLTCSARKCEFEC